jgi:hypothetical protein
MIRTITGTSPSRMPESLAVDIPFGRDVNQAYRFPATTCCSGGFAPAGGGQRRACFSVGRPRCAGAHI